MSAAAPETAPRSGFLPRLQRFSTAMAGLERGVAGLCLAVVFVLLVLNIVTRAAGQALFWVDEAAITAMVWMAFFAALVGLQARSNIAVTLLADAVPIAVRLWLAVLVDLILLLFVIALAVMVWRWFAPVAVWRAGGDLRAFAEQTFNFMYQEPTLTLGIRKVWPWLVLPMFVLGGLVHCVANLDDSLARALGGED
ncbi:TRAP transporter small permease [Alloalcanivorax marinus]|uniref:TRAP transporter small permease n=1 Tax=Alloalcanivorax marinus TaxID=1177169 RepID=UPI00193171BC|nr:TRAP transporter small permease subunit [Alloalcanivorax marinus]MBL7249369.1 TRAP transporter small permease subunit [Alloalcanivorax marinus]